MEELHRELLKKRKAYLQENVIMEDGLLTKLKEKGLFTNTMVSIIQVSVTTFQDICVRKPSIPIFSKYLLKTRKK